MPVAAATSAPPIDVRPLREDDVAFVASTWKQSFWRESTWGSRVRWPPFNIGHGRIITELLLRSRVLIANVPGNPGQIMGFLVYELGPKAIVHYAYTKPPYRHAGVLRTLLLVSGLPDDLSGVLVSHATKAWFSNRKDGRRGIEEKYPLAVHDPYAWLHPR